MKKIISSILVSIFLIGCGGSSASDPQAKAETKSDDKKQALVTDKDGKVKTIKLSGSAEAITLSKDALFVAKGEDGVEIVKIGYEDSISSELIGVIDGINAKSLSLSEDESKLYVENEQGFINIINISNLSSPVKESVTTKQEIQKFTTTKDKNYEFRPKGRDGLEIYDISNPASPTLSHTFDKSNAYDIVLADNDTKALVAAGETGINLLDITTITQPNMIVNFEVQGGVKGLSLNKDEGLLFVANGDNGVLIYSLNVMLDKVIK